MLIADDAPKLAPATALRTLARIGLFLRPYRGRVALALIALFIAAGATLAIGQGLKGVIDRRRRRTCASIRSPGWASA